MIVTAGAIDCHVHFICPQLAFEAITSGEVLSNDLCKLHLGHRMSFAADNICSSNSSWKKHVSVKSVKVCPSQNRLSLIVIASYLSHRGMLL